MLEVDLAGSLVEMDVVGNFEILGPEDVSEVRLKLDGRSVLGINGTVCADVAVVEILV